MKIATSHKLTTAAIAAIIIMAAFAAPRRANAAPAKNQNKIFYLILCSGTNAGDILETGPAAKNIAEMTSSGSTALLSMRAQGRLSLANVYFSINTSNYTKCKRGCNLGFNAFEPFDENFPAIARFATSTGIMPAPYNVLNLFRAIKPITSNVNYIYPGKPGLLGSVLSDAGIPVYVYGNYDFNGLKGYNTRREISLVGMSTSGETTYGDVSTGILKNRKDFPLGLSLDEAEVMKKISAVKHGPALVIVELSDIQRLESILSSQDIKKAIGADVNPDFEKAWYLTTISRSDGMVGDILSLARKNGGAVMLALIGSMRRDGFIAIEGSGIPSGELSSKSTKRPGYVTLLDVAPTILDFYGITQPPKMYGKPMLAKPSPGVSSLEHLAVKSSNIWLVDFRIRPIFCMLYCSVIIAMMLLAAFTPRSRFVPLMSRMRFPIYFVSFMPLASCVPSFFPLIPYLNVFLIALGAAALLAVTFGLAAKRNWAAPLYFAAFAFIATLAVDICTGVRMPLNSVFGYSTHYAGRFHGVGNIQMAQMVEASVLLVSTAFARKIFSNKRQAILAAIVGSLCSLAMLPGPGTNFGGFVTAFVTFTLFCLFLLGRRLSLKTVIVLFILSAVGVAGLFIVAKYVPAVSQTHFGLFFGKLLKGDTVYVYSILKGKAKLLLTSFLGYEWVLLIAAIIFCSVTMYGKRFNDIRALFAERPDMYSAARALFIGGIAGFIFNDSGVSVPANMWIYWIFIALLIIAANDAENANAKPETETQEVPPPPAEPSI